MNNQITFLQIFGVLLVVVGHAISRDSTLHAWIYNFHMPLFMFISGYLFIYVPTRKGENIGNSALFGKNGLIVKKFKRLIVPYILISSLTFIPKAYLSQYAMRPITFSFKSWLDMLIYPIDNVIIYFWFLPTLFIIMMIAIGYYKISFKYKFKIPLIVIILVCTILHIYNPALDIKFLNISGVLNYLLYFVLGVAFCLQQAKIEPIVKNPVTLVITFFLSILFIYYFADFGLVKAICGITFCISLSYVYLKYNFKFFNHLCGSTFVIYLFSWYPQTFIIVMTDHYNIPMVASAIISTILGIYIPFAIYKLMIYLKKKYKLVCDTAFLLGC